ncbi:MAG: DegT/DnrJ/EryC1/StrS family aminotransferase [Eisenbergiella sp.]
MERKKGLFHPSNEIQEKFGRVIVLDDAAHAFGASRDGKMCGEVADFTSFSFHAVKNLTTAEGGALVWREIPGIDNDWIYNQFMLLSLHGQNKDALAKCWDWEYDIVMPAYKCNMTDISRDWIGQTEISGDTCAQERDTEKYRGGLSELPVDMLMHTRQRTAKSSFSYHLCLVRLNGKGLEFRNQLIIDMAEAGVAANVHYKPLPMHTAYKKLGFDIKVIQMHIGSLRMRLRCRCIPA